MNNDASSPKTAGEGTSAQLYQVRPGIPFDRALEELSDLLGCIRHLTYGGEMENDRQAVSAVRHLSALAKALIDDMEVNWLRSRPTV